MHGCPQGSFPYPQLCQHIIPKVRQDTGASIVAQKGATFPHRPPPSPSFPSLHFPINWLRWFLLMSTEVQEDRPLCA